VTRCIDAAGDPRCVAECDFDKSTTGCRPGYRCVLRQRYDTTDEIFPVCLPEDVQRWPGESAPVNDIGDSCNGETDCNSLSCLPWPGGMCTKTMCDYAGCPSGSSCVGFTDSNVTACIPDCTTDGQCRDGEGYVCSSDYDLCLPGSNEVAHDDTVGVTDCANAWGSGGDGLSSCDLVPDDYVVINKSARNMAFCDSGSLVANYRVGLGFSPIGDKTREGDGKTPEGTFYIPRVLPSSQYYKAFLLSYPDKADATVGLSDGVIDAAEKTQIDDAQDNCTEPPQYTGLGGLIEVHGMGGSSDWTWGCIAIENSQIDALWAEMGVGDTIVVLP
jgi:hypothetical protein